MSKSSAIGNRYDLDVPFHAGRGGIPHREEPRYPAAANIQYPSEAELLAVIQRALRGDPHPAASVRSLPDPAPPERPALASRIRDILRGDPLPQEDAPVLDIGAEPEPAIEPEPVIGMEAGEPPAEDPQPVPPPAPVARQFALPRWPGFTWTSIAFVIAASVIGAAIPSWLAGPPRYAAQARLELARGVAARPGLIDAAAARLTSPALLSLAVAKLDLDRDPDFAGGQPTAIGVAMDLVAGNGAASDALSRAQAALRGRIAVSNDRSAGTLSLSVTSGDASKSARIANFLADAVADAAPAMQGSGTALAEAGRRDYDQASAALSAFTQQNGADKIKAALDLQQRQQDLGAQLTAADNAVQAARIRQTAARTTVTLSDVLDGSMSPDLGSPPALEDLRNRYAAARTVLVQLSAQLGPRHPRLLAQQSTVDGLRGDIQAQLQQLAVSSEADLKAAIAQQKALSDRRAALPQPPAGIDMVRFHQLQADVEAARSRYEDATDGAGDLKPTAAGSSLAVIPAVVPTLPLDDDLAGNEMAGFLMGLAAAFALVFLRQSLAAAILGGRHGVAAPPLAEDAVEPEADGAAGIVRNEPAFDMPRLAIEPTSPRFDAAGPVANDRPASPAAPRTPAPAAEDLALVRHELASLKSRLETYAIRRQAARR